MRPGTCNVPLREVRGRAQVMLRAMLDGAGHMQCAATLCLRYLHLRFHRAFGHLSSVPETIMLSPLFPGGVSYNKSPLLRGFDLATRCCVLAVTIEGKDPLLDWDVVNSPPGVVPNGGYFWPLYSVLRQFPFLVLAVWINHRSLNLQPPVRLYRR